MHLPLCRRNFSHYISSDGTKNKINLFYLGNQLSEIPLQKLPSSLEVLLLAENQISSISLKLVQYLENLKYLNLKENAIE